MIRSISFRSTVGILLFIFLFMATTDAFAPLLIFPSSSSMNTNGPATVGPSQAIVVYMSEEGAENTEDDLGTPPTPPQPVIKCPDCDLCDGSGRILGGIPTILPWWPIKPYRPCPNFIARGGKYTRIGQPLDEIAFGRGNIDAEDDDF